MCVHVCACVCVCVYVCVCVCVRVCMCVSLLFLHLVLTHLLRYGKPITGIISKSTQSLGISVSAIGGFNSQL